MSDMENINVSHSRFLSEASPRESWKDGHKLGEVNSVDIHAEDEDSVPDGKGIDEIYYSHHMLTDYLKLLGKLSPTSSHLFKLILPLGTNSTDSREPPTVFLLHPSQPLSHVSRLITSSLSIFKNATHPHVAISFQSTTPRGNHFKWSESTDVGDFVRDAARSAEFQVKIRLSHDTPNTDGKDEKFPKSISGDTFVIPVSVPTFASRTRFLRRRLVVIDEELGDMDKLKRECDLEAHRGAKRMAVTGLGVLVVYWGAVARLTFWDYGW